MRGPFESKTIFLGVGESLDAFGEPFGAPDVLAEALQVATEGFSTTPRVVGDGPKGRTTAGETRFSHT